MALTVLTNGCFDVLHRGHVEYLTAARALGDRLIVGVNDDASVRRRKGPGRPVNTAADRAAVLAALRCVDEVVVFGEDTACELVAAIRPDVYVKGADYAGLDLPEADVVRGYGGRVLLLPYLDGYSTTRLLAENVKLTEVCGLRPAIAGLRPHTLSGWIRAWTCRRRRRSARR